MDKPDFLQPVAGRFAGRGRFADKESPRRVLALGSHRLLFNNLPDADIDRIFRTVAVPFPCDALGHHVRSLGSSHIVEVPATGAIRGLEDVGTWPFFVAINVDDLSLPISK